MSEEEKKELKKEKEEEQQQQQLSVQDIINTYPVDREKVRDILLINISGGINRIANALEYFANQDVADRKVKEIQKP